VALPAAPASAKTPPPPDPAHAPAASGAHASTGAAAEIRGAFFSEDEAATIAAMAERIMPSGPGMAGAREANVINYIDLALAGAYQDLQEFYRHGIAALDAYCMATFKEAFVYLKPAQQDEALRALESGKATGFTFPPAQAFFATVRTHTMEGMFADPVYGGNRDFVGWKLVGFPGAQRLYTTADLKNTGVFTRQPIVGLQAVDKATSRRK
jgi:gluconate 2-dehydrogenase gamma chain